MRIPTWLHHAVTATLGILLFFTASLFIYIRHYRSTSENASELYRPPYEGTRVFSPNGYTPTGVKIDSVPPKQAGWIVRYAARACSFCRQDEDLWRALALRLQQMGYQAIVIVPSERDKFVGDSSLPQYIWQEAFVDVEWTKHFSLTKTPTFLLFDSRGALTWSHEGMLTPGDFTAAVKAVESLKSRIALGHKE